MKFCPINILQHSLAQVQHVLNYMHKADLLHCSAGTFDIFDPKISELLPYRNLVQLYVFHKNYEEQNNKRSLKLQIVILHQLNQLVYLKF